MKALLYLLFLAAPTLVRAAEFGVDAKNYDGPAWSPYVVGAAIGVLSWLTFYFADKPIGASSFYATIGGMLGKVIAPAHTRSLDYFKKNPPSLDWSFLFLIFTIIGALIAAGTGGEIKNEWLHPMWVDKFGSDSMVLRGVIGFAGGALMAFGARLAGGCTSGHGISGTLQLNVGSWLTVIFMFIAGIATAMLLYTFL